MMDRLGIVQTILSLVPLNLIFSAVDKVKQNEQQCEEIARRVGRLGDHVSSLNNNAEAVISALDDLKQAMDDALDVVLECQKEGTVSRLANANKLSEKLRRANDSISEQVMTVMLVAILGNTTQQEEAASISCSKKFDLSELKDATDNFSEENVIGESASCTVYRGKLRDGTKVAVRSYSEERQCQNEAYFEGSNSGTRKCGECGRVRGHSDEGEEKPHRKFDKSMIDCRNCGENGHFASECTKPRRKKKQEDSEEALFAAADTDDVPALL